ncbi:hypothetical protein L3N51_01733 [Metallosphaera sp. J1]|uniref:hypothetical protein n=1 Tax=Metallosphaera javensis (ex Hofmann et al. 2022) TaxID=99938 RepID=UPI001EE024B9|nr:hypothetical protein [Metallosphaera javensis (ex Hofmann et al. 2022)]MCG3109441.1 hypothetical protein [Metallosphaera javensis (ex Hofmann et al. 2022)]
MDEVKAIRRKEAECVKEALGNPVMELLDLRDHPSYFKYAEAFYMYNPVIGEDFP